MGRLIEMMSKAGVLVATGAIKSRNTGMKIVRRQDRVTVEEGPVAGSSLMAAAGRLARGARAPRAEVSASRRRGHLRNHRSAGARAAADKRGGVIIARRRPAPLEPAAVPPPQRGGGVVFAGRVFRVCTWLRCACSPFFTWCSALATRISFARACFIRCVVWLS